MRGREGEYEWAARLGPPWRLVRDVPSIVIGKRVVITAFDFGPPRVSDDEECRGWRQAGDMIITSPIESYDDIVGALSDEGSEIWVFDPSHPIPNFGGWEHTAGQGRVISLAPPEREFPDPPPSWDMALVEQDRAGLASQQEHLRAGLTRFQPLSFLRDDLIVTRDPVAIAGSEDLFAKSSHCACSPLGDATWVKPQVPIFTAPFELLDRAPTKGISLHRCRTCNTYWLVEEAGEEPLLAMRLEGARHWEATDRWPARRRLIVEAHGGEEERACRWAYCERRALRGMEICAEHAKGKA